MRIPVARAWPRIAAGLLALAATCAGGPRAALATEEPAHSAELDAAIVRAAQRHGIPERLVRRVVMRESRYNPRARNHSFWGLMQISYPTARSMGFKGTPEQLLNPVTNLTYAVPYLANAFVIAGKREDAAIRLYAHGYYDAARSRGLLSALRTADSAPAPGFKEEQVAAAAPSNDSIFGWFGTSQASPDAQPAPAAAVAEAQPATQAAAPAAEPAASKPTGRAAKRLARAEGAEPAGMPAQWKRDGGMTTLARGEQGLERFAAYAGASRVADRRTGRSRKSTAFASLDAVPATAQAYSAYGAESVAAPQQAISQVISAQPNAQDASGQAVAAAESLSVEEGAAKKPKRVAAKRHVVAAKKPAAAVAELKP